jgi:hypothetical protein
VHYETRNALPPAPHEKNMLYKVTSRYTAKFSGRSLPIGEQAEYRPFGDLRSVPESGRPKKYAL